MTWYTVPLGPAHTPMLVYTFIWSVVTYGTVTNVWTAR